MKRLVTVILVLCAILAGAFVLLPFLISSESVRSRIIEQAATLTGRRMSFRAAPKVFFNPYLGIAIDSVIFEGPKRRPDETPLAEMKELRGRIAILPALFGRIEVTQYQFVRPRFNLKIYEDGQVSWAFPDGKVWQILDQARTRRLATEPNAKVDLGDIARLTIGQFEIIDGSISFEDERTGAKELFTNVNARVNWPDSASAWTIGGSTIWRDEALDFSVRSAQPLLLMAGGTSTASASIRSGAFQFSFSGDANMLASLHLAGQASMSAPSIPRLVNLLGGEMEPGVTPGEFSASGMLNGTPRQVQLTNAELSFNGNKGRGVVQLAHGGATRPQINATLAFGTFDFTPYLATLQQEAEINRPELAGLSLIDRFDSDIRLSAGEARFGAFSVANLAGALSLRNGELSFDLGNGTLFGGTAMGAFSVKKNGNGLDLSGKASLSDLRLGPALQALVPRSRVTANAVADVQLDARSSGRSARDVMDNLRGWLSFTTGKGSLSGADLKRLHSAGNEEDETGVMELSGDTPFDSLSGNLIFNQGAVWIRDFDLDSATLRARTIGRADLASGGLALRVRLSAAEAQADMPDAFLFVGGVTSSPLVTRDRDAAEDAAPL